MTEKEKYYDDEIAPLLRKIAKMCKEKGMSMVCAVEFNRNEIARTALINKDPGIEISMVHHCAKTVPNIDAYVIGIKRYCKEKGIDTNQSVYLSDRL